MTRTLFRRVWLLCTGLSILSTVAFAHDNWPMFGQNQQNTASNDSDPKISTSNVAKLAPKWVATTGGDVSARPAVVGGVVFFPDWGGNLWALDARTGTAIWHHQLSYYGVAPGTVSRTSPAVDGNTIYVGTQQGAFLLAVDANTGTLRWRTQLDTHPLAIVTASSTVFANVVYTGVASTEEGWQRIPAIHAARFAAALLR